MSLTRNRRRWPASPRSPSPTVSPAPPRSFERFASEAGPALEQALARSLPSRADRTPHLSRAIEDAVLSPGKRLRPILTLAAGELVRAPAATARTVAVAVEYLHAASLVLDDLPSMDDARRRRGRPAIHVVYGVATAELAAVSLLARAFEIVGSDSGLSAAVRTRIAAELGAAVGVEGCCGGQAADLSADTRVLGLEDLEAIHARKTGALFVAAVRGGALAGGAGEGVLDSLTRFARNLGLAFQITDDLLDLEGDPSVTGKDVPRRHRANLATVLGRDTARALVLELLETAASALAPLGARADVLADVTRVVGERRA